MLDKYVALVRETIPGYDAWKTASHPDTPLVLCMHCGDITDEIDTCLECQVALSEAQVAAEELLDALNTSAGKGRKIAEDLGALLGFRKDDVRSLRSELSDVLRLFERLTEKLGNLTE